VRRLVGVIFEEIDETDGFWRVERSGQVPQIGRIFEFC
jgi:hypothetical protein